MSGEGGSLADRQHLHSLTTSILLEDFAQLVEPLEIAAGKRLNGRGRTLCLGAFVENQAGLDRCAAQALEEAQTNPLGLLISWMISRGHHLREIPGPFGPLSGPPAEGQVT